jgi:hypothetical protein
MPRGAPDAPHRPSNKGFSREQDIQILRPSDLWPRVKDNGNRRGARRDKAQRSGDGAGAIPASRTIAINLMPRRRDRHRILKLNEAAARML